MVLRKGQVTIPMDIRKKLDIKIGDTVLFKERDGRVDIVRQTGAVDRTAGLSTDHPTAIREALFLWERHGPLSFPDCFHLALARQLDVTQIYFFHRKTDRHPGVTRIEP